MDEASKPGGTQRRHHLVTRSYLEGFTLPGSADQLFAIDSKRGAAFTTNIKNLAVEKDFYRAENSSGDPNLVEKMLGEIEAAAMPVIRHIDEKLELPSGIDLQHLVFFISNLWARVRHFRSAINEFIGNVHKKIAFEMTATRERWESIVAKAQADGLTLPATDYAGMKEFIESEQYDIESNRNWLVKMMLESTTTLFDQLVHRRWVLYTVPDQQAGPWFITNDQPVGIRWNMPVKGLWGPGFGLRNTVVMMPLTRRCYLEGYLPPDLERTRTSAVVLDAEEVSLLNRRTIDGSGDALLAPHENFIWLGDKNAQMVGPAELLAYIRRRIESERT